MAIQASAAQQPIFTNIVIPAPAAGVADYFAMVPSGQQWELSTVFVSLTSSSTAGNRNLFGVAYTPDGHTIGIVYSTIAQTANGYFEYSMATSGFAGDTNETGGFIIMGLPTFILSAGCTFHVKCIGFKSNDQLGELCIGAKVTYPYKF